MGGMPSGTSTRRIQTPEAGRQAGQRTNGNEAWIYRREIVDMPILARDSTSLYKDYKREWRHEILYTAQCALPLLEWQSTA